jgi:multidrug resistance protein, MATE family
MSLVDTLFVGRLGSLALGAIGIGSITALTLVSFGSALLVGARVEVGNDFGRGARDEVRASLGPFLRLALWLGFGSILAALAAGVILPRLVEDLAMGTLAADYLRVRALSYPSVLLAAAVGQWLNAQGHARAPMIAAFIANAVNVPLNAALVIYAGFGVVGSAWATFLAQALEATLLLYFVARGFGLGGWSALLRLVIQSGGTGRVARFFRLGFATGAERAADMLAFSSVPLLLSFAGSEEVGAHQIALQISLFAFLPTIALGDATTTLVAQAVGANRPDLVGALRSQGLRVGAMFSVSWALLCVAFRSEWVGFFSSDPRLVPSAMATLVWVAILQPPNTAYNLMKGVLRGLRDFRAVALCTSLCAWIVSPPLTLVLGVWDGRGARGAWQAFLVEVLIGLSYLVWRSRRLIPKASPEVVDPLARKGLSYAK